MILKERRIVARLTERDNQMVEISDGENIVWCVVHRDFLDSFTTPLLQKELDEGMEVALDVVAWID